MKFDGQVQRGTFDCCKHCGDKRTIGCHGYCKDYIDAVRENNKRKRQQRIENIKPNF